MLTRMKVLFCVRRVSIIFLLTLSFVFCCRPVTQEVALSLIFENNKATGIVIRGVNISEHELTSRLKIELVRPGERTPVLGEFKLRNQEVKFEPLVPFTRNLKYEVFL